MSVVTAFITKENGYIATDSQITNLKTLEPQFDAEKSRKIHDCLLVGFAGHADVCTKIIDEATVVHAKRRSDNWYAYSFIASIRDAILNLEQKFNDPIKGKYVANFLVVGYNGDDTIMLLIYGTATNFKMLTPKRCVNGVKYELLLPDDVKRDTYIRLANDLLQAPNPDLHLKESAQALVQAVCRQSQYCGGEPQILELHRHSHSNK